MYFRLIAILLAAAFLSFAPAAHASKAKPAVKPQVAAGKIITLKDTINSVLQHHRELRGMQENRQALVHELDRARAGFGPRVDVQGSGGLGLTNDSSTRKSDLNNRFLGVVESSAKLTQPVWDGFATRSRVRAAQSTLDSVKARVLDTATSLSLEGIIAQIDLIRQKKIYELAQRNVAKHKSILAQAKDRNMMGADTMADVTQAQSRLARAQSSLADAHANLVIAQDTYARLTGVLPGKNIQDVGLPPDTFKGPKEVVDIAEKNNPKLAAYMQDIRTRQADKQLATSSMMPTFNIQVGPTYSNRNSYDDRWSFNMDAMGTVTWNIFNSGADAQAIKASNARIRESRQTLYNFMDNLKLEIDNTWTQYLSAQEQKKNYFDAVKYNKSTCGAYLEQFQMGKRSLLDVLDAENELFNSSTQAETAKGNILVSAYKLSALSGNLLSSLGIDTNILEASPEEDAKDPREDFDKGWFK